MTSLVQENQIINFKNKCKVKDEKKNVLILLNKHES